MSNIARFQPTLWLNGWPATREDHSQTEPLALEGDEGKGVEYRDPAPKGGFNPVIKKALQRQLNANFRDVSPSRAAELAVPGAVVETARRGNEEVVERAFTIKDAIRMGRESL